MTSERKPSSYKSIFKEWLLASAVFLVWISVFFYPAVFQGQMIYTADYTGSDLTDFNIPRRHLVAQAIKDGEFPQWEPLVGCGTTVFAEGHPGMFYPLGAILHVFLPTSAAANVSALSALYIAFLGVYWLIRLHGAKPASSLLGAMTFAWGGSMIFRLRYLNISQVIAWIPVSFALIRLYLQSGRRLWWFAIVLVWSLQLFAGHPQVVFYSQMAYWLYIAAWLAFSRLDIKRRFQRLGILILAGVLAVMIGAPQWMPTYEMTQLTLRHEKKIGIEKLNEQSFNLANLSCLINPYRNGNPAVNTPIYPKVMSETRLYWGTLVLLFALGAWSKPTRRMAIFWTISSIIFLWLSLGYQGWLYPHLCLLFPKMNLFRYPCRLLLPVGLGVAILGALGMDNFCRWLSTKSKRTATALTVVFLVATAGELGYNSSQFHSFFPKEWSQPPAILKAIGPDHQRIYTPITHMHFFNLIIGYGWRYTGEQIRSLYNGLPIDTATIWGVPLVIDQASIAHGLTLTSNVELCQYLGINIENDKSTPLNFHISRSILNTIRLCGVSHIVCMEPLFTAADSGITTTVFRCPITDTPFYIYKLDFVLPEARLVPSLTAELPKMYKNCPAPYADEFIAGLYEPDPEHPQNVGKCTAVAPTRNTYRVITDYEQDSYLVLSRSYHPNWRVSIDGGEEQPVLLVNTTFQAVKVPAGHHQLEFRYSSPALKLGGALCATALVILVIVGFWGRKRSPKDTVPELSTPKTNADETGTKETVAAETSTSETSTTHTNAP